MGPLAQIHMEVLGKVLPSLMRITWIDRKGRRELEIPRYAPWTGWIEIFFLHPQEEWVELTGLRKFKGRLEGNANGLAFDETIEISRDARKGVLEIRVDRSFQDGRFERGVYLESWGPVTKSVWYSKHDTGHLATHFTKYLVERVPRAYKGFVEAASQRARHFREFQLWVKEFQSFGGLPSWKSELAPLSVSSSGSSIEAGFLYIKGHGDWFKYFEYDGTKLLIIEEGFEWAKYRFRGKNVFGKKRYHLYLFEVRDLEEATKVLGEFKAEL
jgi:hypothetical protein